LNRPVAHVREVRSELLVKLGLLLRRGQPPTGLIAAQRRAFAPVQAALEQQQRTGTGFGQLLAGWRMEKYAGRDALPRRGRRRLTSDIGGRTTTSSGWRWV
jgi:hypothetical protein